MKSKLNVQNVKDFIGRAVIFSPEGFSFGESVFGLRVGQRGVIVEQNQIFPEKLMVCFGGANYCLSLFNFKLLEDYSDFFQEKISSFLDFFSNSSPLDEEGSIESLRTFLFLYEDLKDSLNSLEGYLKNFLFEAEKIEKFERDY